MSGAIAIHHGPFGRAKLYEIDHSLATHAHREGHLIFYLDGDPAGFRIGETAFDVSASRGVAVDPWAPHSFETLGPGRKTIVLTLYINPIWFLENSQSAQYTFNFGTPVIEITPEVQCWIGRLTALLCENEPSARFDGFFYETALTSFRQSWRYERFGPVQPVRSGTCRDFRIRRSVRLISEHYAETIDMATIARQSGLSRPHFFKMFRKQMGLTPHLFINLLRTEHAIQDLVTTTKPIAEIGVETGFSSQANFSRFFAANVGMAPTDYRRVAHIA